jgi:hypothetical protein
MPGSDLDVLRGEHQQISARIFRIATASIIILFVTVMAFTRALRRVDGDEVKRALLNIQQASSIAQLDRENDLSYVFRAGYKALDPLPAPATPPDQAAVQQAVRDSNAAVAELEKRASEWFTVKMPLIGADLLIDLRYWIAVVPVLLWFASTWLWIANAKLRVIEGLASRQITAEAAPVNRLLFQRDEVGRPPAFAHYPAQAQGLLFVAGVAFLLIYAVIVGWALGSLLDLLGLAVIVWLFLSWYVAMYAYRASSRIQRQTEELFGLPQRRGIVRRLHDWIIAVARAALAPLRRVPRATVTAGAVIVLSSLFTSLASSCTNDPGGDSRKGYELVLGQRGASWFSETGFRLDIDLLALVPLGRVMYTLSVGMAIVLLLTIAVRRRLPRLVTRLTLSLSICVSAFVVVEIGFVAALGLSEKMVRILIVAFVYYVWWRARRSRYADPRRWEDVRAGFVGAVIPLIALAPMWAAEIAKNEVWGLYVYAAGALLTTVGLSALVEEVEATEAANSRAAPAVAPTG